MKILNERRKTSLIAYLYELSKLTVAGIVLAGILRDSRDWLLIGVGITVAFLFFLAAFYLEGGKGP
ncbi:DUF6722 family protein [Geothermobacter hydrogeniphilus]|uniref:Uncharacterized protein n=1 Tax=Geothermobacter hydrogeniphilus TaxID=1969733 RepID=A0A1X0Y885_9BACT|nr:DUF6722 family protein [Geothermobacter hydrogeniphilus]ORJ61326.1 hypothetical protein B5V00_06755 [Geothermobacter hydrogeniphilus]